MTASIPTWKQEKYRMVERWRSENQRCEKGAIVFAGSSLMEMFPVEAFAKEQGPDFPTVYNRGVGGWRTDDMLPMLDVLVTDLMPRKLFINIGTNDLSDPTVTIDALISRYDRILTQIEACVPGVAITLMAYYPVNAQAADEGMKATLRIRNNERIRAANVAVKALAERHHQRYADFNAPLTDAEGNLRAEYTIEGMHIREEGYRAIWPDVRKAILEA
ncbi:MAG: GDSL-type esterase/lipase family protein [Clostridiales bacterium]|nr:GDSL-type esterase/lipase family protein [Clostridiales bacterium]